MLVEEIPEHLYKHWKKGPLLFATRFRLPVVALRSSELVLRWGHDTIYANAPDCHFRIGRPWQMKRNTAKTKRLLRFGARDLILIDFPPIHRSPLTDKPYSMNTAPVGYTHASLQEWKEALGRLIEPCNEELDRFLNS